MDYGGHDVKTVMMLRVEFKVQSSEQNRYFTELYE